MKIFISADIEGVNSICNWREADDNNPHFKEFKKQMTEEVKMACLGSKNAGATEIVVKDAHSTALNLSIADLPDFVQLHRGWEGNVCSMMGGLDDSFDAVMFVGYHCASRSDGNPLSHTMNTKIVHLKINGSIASEFDLNAFYAAYLNVPVAFLSGDLEITKHVQAVNNNIEVVATKEARKGAVISRHPNITNQEILNTAQKSLKKDLQNNIVTLPDKFDVEIQYRSYQAAYKASHFPGCKLSGTDRVVFSCKNYYDVLVALHFIL